MDVRRFFVWFYIIEINDVCQAYFRCKVNFNWTYTSSSICFLSNGPRLIYTKSQSYCSSLHPDMHLPIAKDQSTVQFLTESLKSSGITAGFWLGAFRTLQKKETNFLWADGTKLLPNSTLWASSQPSGNGKCAVVRQQTETVNNIAYRKFDDLYCTKEKVVVCSCQTVEVQKLNATDDLFLKSPSLRDFKADFQRSVEEGGNPLIALDSIGQLAAEKVLRSNKSKVDEKIENEHFKFELKKFDVSSFLGGKFTSTNSTATIEIPKEIFQSDQKNTSRYAATVGIAYSAESTAVKFANQSKDWTLNSDIISYSAVYDSLNFKKPVVLTFSLKHEAKTHENAACAFWNTKTNSWSQDGCFKVFTNHSIIVCHCYHLTVFASLMQVFPDSKLEQFTRSESFSVEIMTYVCFTLSYIGLGLTIATHLSSRILKKECNFIRMNLCIAILLAQTAYLCGIGATRIEAVCKFVAFLLHYLYLTVGAWMLAEGISIALMTIRIIPGTDKRWRYCIFGWGSPLVLVSGCFAVLHEGYGQKHACWLEIENGTIWAFAGPTILILLFNICVVVVAIRATLTVRINRKKSESERIRVGIKALLVLLPLLGLTWLFGLFAVGAAAKPMQILFSISNGLQGFFIFIFHCLKNPEVRKSSFLRVSLGRISAIPNNKACPSPASRLQVASLKQPTSIGRNQTPVSLAVADTCFTKFSQNTEC